MEPSKLLDWTGKTCVIAASGPSLTDEQCALAELTALSRRNEFRLMAVNTTFKRFVAPDVIYGCDYLWHRHHNAEIPKHLKSHVWTQDRSSAERFQLNFVRQSSRPGLGKKTLQVNGNSGAGAINLAYLFGCRRILLIGFDLKLGPKGERHWHKDHPAPLVQNQPFGEWLHKFDTLAKDLKAEGVEVVNCTPGSALAVFPMSTLQKELAC